MTTKFNVGQIYSTRSIGDHDCIISYKIVKRTAKTLWLIQVHEGGEFGEIIPKRVEICREEEICSPWGKYSMSPTLGANDPCLVKDGFNYAQVQEEYHQVSAKLREYGQIAAELWALFEGDALDARLDSLKKEFGLEFLLKRADKLKEKLAA